MIDVIKVRHLYESCTGSRDKPNPRGRVAFVAKFRHLLGLCDERGSDYRDRLGNRCLRESQVQAEEFSLQELAEATCGPAWRNFFNPQKKQGLHDLMGRNALLESQWPGDGRALLEAAGVGIDVSAFADVNAWTAATTGLLERKVLEGFENPEYIGDELLPPENTKIAEGQKIIGVSRIGDKATERQPGEAHTRAGLMERWVTLGKTRENALAVDVTKEAAWWDLTGQLLENAQQHGDWIAYRKEFDQLSCFLGINSAMGAKWQFVYKGTAYQVYQQTNANGLGYTSQLAGNDLVDWKSIESAWLTCIRNTDPETGTRVRNQPDTVVVNPARLATADILFGARQTERRTAPSATQATTGDLHIAQVAGNVVDRFGKFKILWSALLEQLCTNSPTDPVSPGLGLQQTAANAFWWLFSRAKFGKTMVNWPLTIISAPATNYDSVDRGLVLSVFGNERSMPSIHSPWHMLNSTN